MRDIAVRSGEHSWPFSKGLIVESLLNAGIEREAAVAIAKRIERNLIESERFDIDTASLKTLIAEEVSSMDSAIAERLLSQIAVFEDITVLDHDGSIPFSKGILARSLEVAGLSTRDAFELAKSIERVLRLEGKNKIDRFELENITIEELSRRFGDLAREAYIERWQRASQLYVLEEATEVSFPYSKGILAQSLMATGLAPMHAHRIAREVELKIWEHGERTITRSGLRAVVENILRSEISEDFADRYHLLRSIRHEIKPLHILIGGVTGTGKSLLAAEVAYRLGITRVESTDSIRQVMRAMISPELLPTLHASTFDAWKENLEPGAPAIKKPSKGQLLEGFRDQVAQVSVGLKAIIERSSAEHTSLVVEGVHVVPGFLPITTFKDATVISMVMIVGSEDEHRKRFYLRDQETNQHRPVERYLNHFEEIRNLQNYIALMAKSLDVPILDGESLDRAVEGAIEVIASRLLKRL